MFGLHPIDLIAVLAVALLIFGPKKLPEMGSAIGKSIKEFRKGMNELNNPETKSSLRAPKEAIEETRLPAANEPVVASTIVSEPVESNIEKPLD